ncbi:hypothetical protein [Slackia isoflavoniconvertens]|uniref:hypothetical protein n=1 Tax=Slackia isoflavoniconvertens TaxID=572010 RepID=UPI003AF044A9
MGFNPFEQIGSAAADAGKFLQDRGNDIAKAASEGANAVAKGAAEGAGAVAKAAGEGADAVAKAASEGAEAAAKAVTSGANQVAEAAASIGKAPIWHQANHAITEDDDDLAAVFVDSSLDELKDKSEEQQAEAQKFLIDFMKKIIRLKGVRIDRPHFLRSELKKKGVSNFDVDFAVSTTPVTAGICESIIENVAKEVIDFETKKSTALSFAAGLPGGAAMAGTIPADITQYYVHAFRVMQKLAYLYGWQSFLDECDDVDDETLYEMAVLLGVMMGVAGANSLLTVVAKNAQKAVAMRVARQTLTKTAWYPVLQKFLGFIGIKVTKQTVGNAAGKVVIGLGGVISGAVTFVGLSGGSARLQKQLKKLPQATEPLPADVASEFAVDSALEDAAEPSADE